MKLWFYKKFPRFAPEYSGYRVGEEVAIVKETDRQFFGKNGTIIKFDVTIHPSGQVSWFSEALIKNGKTTAWFRFDGFKRISKLEKALK